MQAMDGIHSKFGKKKLGVGPCFVPGRNWSMSRDKLSRNPFKWDELLTIKLYVACFDRVIFSNCIWSTTDL